MNTKNDVKGNKKQGVTKPHPSPDPTKPTPSKPDTRIPVKPDEDNDFTKPKPPVQEPQPGNRGIEEPDNGNLDRKDAPGTLNDPTIKGDPGITDPTGPGNPALAERSKTWMLMIMLILSTLIMAPAATAKEATSTKAVTTENAERAHVLINRLEQIRDMDKSTLSLSERKTLKKEVRDIRKELKEISGGVYLSVGAIIIIILLLILIL